MTADGGESAKASHRHAYRMAQPIALSYIGTRQAESDGANSRSNIYCKTDMAKSTPQQLVVCVGNDGYPASLEKRKIYVALRDATADEHGMVRVVDESGEDYLYPKRLFRTIDLSQAVRKAVLSAA
jgi:hypothetical protein